MLGIDRVIGEHDNLVDYATHTYASNAGDKMKITVVGMPSEQTHKFDSAEEMIAAAPGLGWTFKGLENQPHLKAELQGLPKFEELCGPMGNGNKGNEQQVRYETWPAYEMYSS